MPLQKHSNVVKHKHSLHSKALLQNGCKITKVTFYKSRVLNFNLQFKEYSSPLMIVYV